LRRVFDSDFPALVAAAEKKLGDAAALAPRVAEGAIVRAWDARGKLKSVDELRAFLADDVQRAAERTLARRAEHRGVESLAPGGPAGSLDLSHSWAEIAQAINVDPHSAQKSKEVMDAVRHHAAEGVVAVSKGISWRLVAGIAIVALIVIAAGVIVADRASTDAAVQRAIASTGGRITNSGPGQMGNVTLGVGSEVRLAPESQLTVPEGFAGKVRVVKLDGAAAFDVDPSQPGSFRVALPIAHALAVATGTKFVVTAYSADHSATVAVREGTVEVQVGKLAIPVPVGHALVIDSAGATHEATPTELAEGSSWMDGKLTVTDRPLGRALVALRRWYKLDVNVADPSLLTRTASITAPLDSSRAAISAVESSAKVKFDYQGTQMIFKDASAPAAKK
jgi:ferric-dicitrate binding protein FerR (iron transport regulator)